MAAIGKVVQVIGQAVLHGIDGSVKQIFPGDIVAVGDVIETMSGSKVILQLENGRELTIGANEHLAIDDSLVGSFDDVAMDADALQDALEKGETLSPEDEETAAGDDSSASVLVNDVLEGDDSEGYVGSYLLPSSSLAGTTDTDNPYNDTGNNNNDTTDSTVTGDPVYSLAEGATVPPGFVLYPDGSYTIDPTISDYDYLGEGEDVEYDVDIVITYPDGSTEDGVINVVVTGTNDAPVAYAEVITAVEDGNVVTGQLTATDPDVNDTLTFEVASSRVPEGFTLNSDGTYSFDPSSYDYLAAGEQTTLTVDYMVTDPYGETSYETITIVVTGTNDAPVVSDISYSGTEDTSITITAEELLAQATDVDGDDLSIVEITNVTGGTIVDNGDGTYTFTPDKDFNGQATFEFSVTDGTETVTATGKIDIAAVNDAPVAEAVTAEVEEDSVLTGQLSATDVDSDTLTFATKGAVPEGFTLNSDGSYEFNTENYDYLAAGESETYVVSYTVTDDSGAVTESKITITVTGTNDAPVAETAVNAVDEDSSITGQLTATDVDDGAVLTFTTDSTVEGLTLNTDGSYTFDASSYDYLAAGATEVIEIPYTVTDENGATSTAKLTITVTGTNDAPIAEAAVNAVDEDASITGQLTATDVDDNAVLTFTTDSTVEGLTLNTDGSYSFDASSYDHLAAGATETIEIPYTVTDENGATSTAKLTITVTGTNDAPVAEAATNAVDEDSSITGQLTATDADDGAVLTFTTDSTVEGLTLNSDGSYTFDASSYDYLAAGATEVIEIPYTVTDENGATSTAKLTITVTGTNDAPVAEAATNAVDEEATITGQLTATDADDGAVLTFTTDSTVEGLTLNTDGSYTFDASSYDYLAAGATEVIEIPYTVTDENGATSTAKLTITVTGTNDAPVAEAATNAVDEDATISGQLTATDVDDNAVLIFTTDSTVEGLTLNTDGSYTFDASSYDYLAAGATEVIEIPYTVTDENGATSTAKLTITVTGTNDAPVAEAAVNAVDEDSTITGQLTATDVDDNAVLTFTTASTVEGLTLNTDGSYTFDASSYDYLAEGATEVIEIPYTVTDENGATSTAKLTITVTGTNDAPVAEAATNAVDEDATISGQLTATDVDDGAVLTFTTDSTVDGLTLNTDGSYTFDASSYDYLAAGATETIEIPYTVTDENGATSTAKLTITVTGTNDAPVAEAAVNAVEEDSTITGQLTATDADDGAVLTFTTDSTVEGLTLNTDGSYSFDASSYDYLAAGATEVIEIPYTVTDENGATSTSKLTITVTGTNDAPVAEAAVNAVDEDSSITGQLTATDADDGAVLTFTTDSAVNGFTLNTDGSYTFDASSYDHLAAGATEVIEIPYTVTDENGATSTSKLTITVTGTNDAPVAEAAVNAVDEDSSITGQLTATDVDDNAVLTFTTDSAVNGFTLNTDGSYTFDASSYDHLAAGATEVIEIPYTVTDENGATSTSKLTITVTGTNDAPIAEAAVNAVDEDASITGQLTATDVDDNAVLTFTTDSTVEGLTLNTDGTYTFDASSYDHLAAGATEVIEIPYTVTDENGATSTAKLTITVTGTNDAPVAEAAVNAVEEDATITGQLTATDADDGAVLTFTTDSTVDGFTLNGDGGYTFDASSYDYLAAGATEVIEIPYTVTDENGATSTSKLTITVTGTNDAPVAEAAVNAVDEDSSITGQLTATDADDNAVLTFTTDSTVEGLTLNTDGSYSFDASSYDYLAAGATETIEIPYTVTDENGATSTAKLTITVTGTNDAPVAEAAVNAVEEDATITGQLTATDVDDGAVLTFTTDSTVDGFTLNGDGSYTFDASSYDYLAAGATETIEIPYTVTDENGATSTAKLTITVTGTNDAPVAEAAVNAVDEDASITGQLTATDVDDGAVLTFTTDSTVEGLALNTDGSYSFDASSYDYLAAGATEVIEIPYTVTDENGATSTAKLTITVTGTNDAPVAEAAVNAVDEDSSITGQLTATDADDGAVLTFSTDSTVEGLTLNTDGSYTFDASSYDYLAAGATEVIEIPYTVTDENGATSTAKLTITVTGTNDAPVAEEAVNAVDEDASITGQLTATDADDGAVLTFTTDSTVEGLTLNTDGSYSFDASSYDYLAAGATETIEIPYTVTDENGATSTAKLTITVTGTNDAPVAEAAVNAVDEDSSITGQLTATDVDDGAVLTFTTASTVEGLTLNTDGSYTFDASSYDYLAAGATEVIEIPYTVTDENGATSTAKLTITVTGTNDAPVAEAAVNAVDEDSSITGQLTATDVDDSAVLTFTTDSTVEGLTLNTDGSYTFDASGYDYLAAGATEVIEIPYTVTDENGATSTAKLTITVTGTNDAPVAEAAVNAVEEDSTITGQLTATDVDDGAVLTFTTDSTFEGLTLNTDGSYTFDASSYDYLAAGATEVIEIPYTVTDENGATSTSKLTITVTGTNDAPVAEAAVNAVDEDSSITGQLTATDVDDNAVLTFTTDSTVEGLTLNTDGSYTFDASSYDHLAAGATETIEIPYTVTDENGATSTAKLTITVTGTNDAPVAEAAVNAVDEDSTITGQLTATDVDDNAVLTFTTDSTVDGFTLNGDGSYTFDASGYDYLAAGATEVIEIPYTVTDENGATSTAKLTITVTGTNDAPVAEAAVNAVEEDSTITGQLTATDVDDGAVLTFTTDSTVEGLTLNTDGSYTFDASSYDYLAAGATETIEIPYTVTDENGATSTAKLTITVTGTNDAPVAEAAVNAVEEDSTITGQLTATDVDDGAVLTFTTDSTVEGLTLNTDGSYTFDASSYDYLAAGATEVIEIPYTVTDENGATSTAKLTITVTGTNDGPVAGDVSFTTPEDTAIVLTAADILANSSDVDGDNLTIESITNVTGGTLVDNGDGTYTFTPSENFNGEATFEFTVTDGTETVPATAKIDVTPVNDAPETAAKSDTVYEDTVLTGSVSATDADGDTLTYALVGTAPVGFTLNSDGTYTFDANSYDYLAKDQTVDYEIKYTVTDGNGDPVESVLNIQVVGTNDAPVAHNVGITVSENGNSAQLSLIASDVDSDQSNLTYALVEGQDIPAGLVFDAENHTVQFKAGTSYDYLTKGESVSYSIQYSVTDEYGATDIKTITVTVNGANDKPVIDIANVETDVTFVGDGGSYTNALGVYTTDENGNIVSGEFILLNSDTASINELLATYQGEDVKFFIVTNVGSSFSGGEVTFTTDADGNPVLLVDGEEISNNVFYSDAEFNFDGIDHFIENEDGTIGIEDLVYGTGGYDGDFNDLVVKTTTYDAVYTENGAPMSIASDVNISDVDSENMSGMTITLTNMQEGDVLSVGDLPDGITLVSIDGNTVTLTGLASAEDYEAALKAVMFSSTSEDPSTVDREFRVVVTDETGAEGRGYVYLGVEAVDETYEAPVAVDDTATVTEVNDVIITGDATVTKVETGTELNSDVSPESLGYTTATTYSTVSMNQNISVNSSYVIIENVPYTFNVNGNSGNGFVEIGNVASGATVNVNIGGGNDIVYLSGTVTGYVNVNGDSGYDVLVLSGQESDYTITTVNNNGTISAYITTADGGYIVANNIEEIRYGGYSESSYEYEVDVVTSETLTDEGYVILAVANGTLSAGTDNGDGTWTVSADELDGLTIIPNGAGTPDVAVAEVHDSGYVTDISDSITSGNLITGTGADYDSDTSVENLYITDVDGTTVSSTGETAIQGEYGTLYVKEDGTYRYEVDNDSEELDNVNSGDSVTEDFTYTLSDGTSTSEAKLTITINGADDISISASGSVVDEGSTSVPVANLLFMIDVSGSMGNVITSEGDTRLDVLKDALTELIDKYDAKGDIGGIQIVTFSTDAYSQTVNGSVWLTVDQAKSILESLRANGATDYDDAISKLMTTYDSSTAPEADYTHAYFVSDGAPSSEDYKINSSELAAWQSWLGDTDVDEVYAVGIGSGTDSQQLQIVAWSADGEGYLDNVLVVPDDTLNADITAAAEQNSRESSVFNDVDIPDGLEAHLTTVTYAGLIYEFSDTVTEYTIDLGDNGSVVINSDGSYVFTAGTDVDQDVTSLLKYSFEVNEHDYSGTLSLTTENHIENIGDFSTYTSGYSVTETDSGFGVKGNYYDSSSKNGIGSGESLTIDFDSEVNTAKFDISGSVKSGCTYSVYDSDGNWVSNGTVTSGELTITSESGISHVVFSGSSSSNYYVEPVSVEAQSGSDNIFAVFGDADSLDFSGLKEIDAIQMNDDSTAQTVTLSAQDVLDIADSSTHTIQISGDSADTLVLSGDWKSTGDNTYCSTVNGTEVCIEINNDDHKLKVQFTDQGDGISS
ncbi:VCBS domain-containing protein [Seleniivibrio sp.]|uniref:Ig-like domain-containing protein n=1 Tax=Seleniivibrio sp. TaxID=2898801 RepID=UPI0025DB1648|nr:VCBS domain-containing protein [Seleniivibrio sp.]MCD8554613.1 Ig-like domain-containing protein [Seleniivibrio sp.]